MKKSLKSLKTPLRYPGGKSRACIKMEKYLPNLATYEQYREPFIGGGSFAIHVTKLYTNLPIWVNDLYKPLATFWQQLQESGDVMSGASSSITSLTDVSVFIGDSSVILSNKSPGPSVPLVKKDKP